MPPDHRNIAQVFQFPVVYDTMTVYDNLAFPLRNRGVAEAEVDARVREIAACSIWRRPWENRASGLTADGKQKISLGRGLVRSDVNVIMFDEPLTVIDPHLKWVLRSKLKELHQQVGATMIYVTHDQTEALTFADQVVVMHDGTVVQVGTPVELFERPQHTFVGHFIGSPGMNVLPCRLDNGTPISPACHRHRAQAGRRRPSAAPAGDRRAPEFVSFAEGHSGGDRQGQRCRPLPVVEARHQECSIKLLVMEGQSVPADSAHRPLRSGAHPGLCRWLDGELRNDDGKQDNQSEGLALRPAGRLLVAFNALIPLMTVVNYSVQETFGDNVFFWAGVTWYEEVLHSPRFPCRAGRQLASSPPSS